MESYQTVDYPYDYQKPKYSIEKTDITIDVHDEYTHITAKLDITRNNKDANELILTGKNLELLTININAIACHNYKTNKDQLIIPINQDSCQIIITNKIYPQKNTYLEGIYLSNNIICSQCEAHGFSRITYYLDQPDVMSVFTTTIIADKQKYPVLLSNGNLIKQEELTNKRHFAIWEDPYKKPCYLFAVVAGNLTYKADKHITRSGREVSLKMFTELHNSNKCEYALKALKEAMIWDEQTYGREYDLDLFMIVAIDHFNMGAMENKGLNIFNSECVLASIDITCDEKFEHIKAVVAHEYFHNWSGNRVTCRDWYQLSLKEGFTVFREQQFYADATSTAIKRIDDINRLFTAQFPEDSGPLSHSVQPRDYSVSDFYTTTIYEKGAELIRMLQVILGKEKFQRGCNIFFTKFDGTAATCEDFITSLENGSNIDLKQFRLWYLQKGTPIITITEDYSADTKNYSLTIEQSAPNNYNTEEIEKWLPLHIPIHIGFLNSNGKDITTEYLGSSSPILHLQQKQQTFIFSDIAEKPIISILRDFSAPVIIKNNYNYNELTFYIENDSNIVNRWIAWNKLTVDMIINQLEKSQNTNNFSYIKQWSNAFKKIISDNSLNTEVKSKLIQLPNNTLIEERLNKIQPLKIYDKLRNHKRYLANNHKEILLTTFKQLKEKHQKQEFSVNYNCIAERKLKNTYLSYLTLSDDSSLNQLAVEQYNLANNMTDKLAALECLLHAQYFNKIVVEQLLNDFYQKFHNDANVLNQWFATQMQSPHLGTKAQLKQLLSHHKFDKSSPNNWRSVLGCFINNIKQFHNQSDPAYDYIADLIIELDSINPQIAAKISAKLAKVHKIEESIKQKMYQAIKKINNNKNLSKETQEVISTIYTPHS